MTCAGNMLIDLAHACVDRHLLLIAHLRQLT
jgi:hypothetical protein